MRHQWNSRPGTRREIIPERCEGKPDMTREWSGAGTVARTHVPHPGVRTNLAREKNAPRTREEARGASALSRGRRIRQTLAQL